MDEEKKKRYRVPHPNLGEVREKMLVACRRQLELHGRRWTARAAARECGVSSGACYRHWKNQREIENELVTLGFHELREAVLFTARNEIEVHEWYAAWAKHNRELYALMFDPQSPVPEATDDIMPIIRKYHGDVSIDEVWSCGDTP